MDILISYGHRAADMEPLPIAQLARQVLAAEGAPANAEVSISFVDDAAIAELNGRYRGIEGPTDVLSFECDTAGDGAEAAGDAPIYQLGDIIIAPDVAERQAAEYGQTLAREIELLVVHGLLHLRGYDHMEEAEAEAMEAREDELLARWREGGAEDDR